MATWVPILSRSSGLNAKYDPATLYSEGATPLAEAVNVVATDMGRLERRDGFTQVVANGGHSIWSNGSYTYFVSGTTLYALESDQAVSVHEGLIADKKVRYVDVLDTVYWSNGLQSGKLKGTSSSSWSASTYSGDRQNVRTVLDGVENYTLSELSDSPDTEQVTATVLTEPPTGTSLCAYRGRIYIGKDNFVHYTEPYHLDWYAPAFNWIPFPEDVVFVAAVEYGVYVGTKLGIYYLGGNEPTSFQLLKVTNAKPIYGTDVNVDASRLGSGEANGESVVVTTQDGIIALMSNGAYSWMTRDKHDRIDGVTGTATFHDGQYIVFIDP